MKELVQPENQQHYKGLDGLRAVAVLIVLIQHYIVLPPEAIWGWTGVRIFFALSGFLITGILFDTRLAARRWSVFYARRALRIFPLYYGVLLVAVALYPVCRWALHPSYWLWPIYMQNFARFFWPPAQVMSGHIDHLYSTRFTSPLIRLRMGHFWSLAIEEQFYFIWPLVVFAVKKRETLMKISLAVVITTPLIRLLCAFTLPESWLVLGFQERFSLVQFDSLLIGAFFALWMRGPHPNLTTIAKWLVAALVGVFIASELLCSAFYGHYLVPNIAKPIFGSLGLSCVDLWGAALVLLAIDPKTLFSRFLQNAAFRQLGTISYGFYVYHDLLHDFYARIPEHFHMADRYGIITGLIALVGTYILASLSFHFIEKPILRLKRHFRVVQPALAQQA